MFIILENFFMIFFYLLWEEFKSSDVYMDILKVRKLVESIRKYVLLWIWFFLGVYLGDFIRGLIFFLVLFR